MPAGTTYNCIATTTSTGSANNVTFSSISASYTDLVVVVSGGYTSSYFDMQFNGDTASNYSFIRMIGFGTTVYTDRYSTYGSMQPSLSATQGTLLLNIANYANTTTNKTVIWHLGNMSSGVELTVGLWRNTAAINSIALKTPTGANMPAGLKFSLYGIAAA
jgi:hypothetical protein